MATIIERFESLAIVIVGYIWLYIIWLLHYV